MPTKIEVDDAEITAAFTRLLSAGENPRPYLAAIGNALADNTRLRFDSSRSPDGKTWPPLARSTILKRLRSKTGNFRANNQTLSAKGHREAASAKPLLDQGILRNSITSQLDGDSVVVGTNVRYGAMQHFGAGKGAFGTGSYRTRKGSFPIPWGDVPPRPFLGVSNDDRSQIVSILRGVILGR
jgi:phage gpG-like protein